MDTGSVQEIQGVATQGRGDGSNEWVSSYTVTMSNDAVSFTAVDGGFEFTGNVGPGDSVVRNNFAAVVTARYVGIDPKTWNGMISMRAGVYVAVGATLPSSPDITIPSPPAPRCSFCRFVGAAVARIGACKTVKSRCWTWLSGRPLKAFKGFPFRKGTNLAADARCPLLRPLSSETQSPTMIPTVAQSNNRVFGRAWDLGFDPSSLMATRTLPSVDHSHFEILCKMGNCVDHKLRTVVRSVSHSRIPRAPTSADSDPSLSSGPTRANYN